MQKLILAFIAQIILANLPLLAQTQSPNLWQFATEATMASKRNARQIFPDKYMTATLDIEAMQAKLAEAPLWQTAAAGNKEVVISLPMPDGNFERFRIMETLVMHPDLQAQHPTIRSYAGQGIDDPAAYFRGDFTPRGFHGMVRSPLHSTVYIDPYSTADVVNYQVYFRKDFSKTEDWQCSFDEIEHEYKPAPIDPLKMFAGDCQLRRYTLALACTGEYATYHGGTTPLVAAAFVTAMTRVNGVYELDASVHMDLVSNNNSLIFLDASTDPYTNEDGVAMLAQNQTTCNNVIGNANYDVGHVFSTGGGGVAGLGVICTTNQKARGVTGTPTPIGDPFTIDYVAHEMGHQFGGNHTFNDGTNGSCTGGNRNASTAYEPGSGSTIMAYAGICAPQNVQSNSDDYFHAISLLEIAGIVTGSGNSCATLSTINSAPTANAGADYVVPRSTPFILTGVGTDPNPADVLNYNWEQMDLGAATSSALTSTLTAGPVFRSYKGTTSPSRYVPRLVDLANNVPTPWEVLPSVARTLNFRLTVRDNHFDPIISGGCTKEDNMVVTVDGVAGPFLVTAPNTGVSWQGASQQTVTWNVAGTTAAPVSCANVDILLSTDGGLTYPTVLATATPNDGTQVITLPNVASTTARIMVKANGNIFYDISNTNFTITLIANSFTVNVSPTSPIVCSPTSAVYNITVGLIGTFSGNVALSVTGLPAGATGTFSTNPVSAPGTSNLTVTTAGVATGTYNLTVTGTNGATSRTSPPTLTVLSGTIGQVALSTPTNGATGVLLTPTLTWAAVSGAITYDVQVSTVPTFATTVVNATGVTGTSYSVVTSLSTNTTYFRRVRAVNSCATGAWATTYSFITYNSVCLPNLASTNVPITISTGAPSTVTSTLNVSGVVGNIVYLKLKNLLINHTWIGDIKATLTSPGNVEYVLFDRPGFAGSGFGCDQNNIFATFDDAAVLTAAQFESTCVTTPPATNAITGTYQPVTLLAPLTGTSPNSTWTLKVQDFVNGDGGSLQGWSLEFLTNCEPVLNLTQTYIEGYMNSAVMRPVMLNSSVPGATEIQSDTITAALHASTFPHAQVYSTKTVLSTTGAAIAKFPTAAAGNSYYVVVKGRNLLETWSANPVAFSATTAYNFGAAGQAYGSNLVQYNPPTGPWVIYSGNFSVMTPNGDVGIEEYSEWEADFNELNSGYILTDLDGDGEADIDDYSIWEANFNNLISVMRP